MCVHDEGGGGGGREGEGGRNSCGAGGEGKLAAELAYTLIDHKKRRGNLVLNISVLR